MSESETVVPAGAHLSALSKEERDVLSGLVNGMTNKAIAASLRMDLRRVELCRIRLIRALNVQS